MAHDTDIERAINALSATLGDQEPSSIDAGRLQEIVTGALGGEPLLRVTADTPDRFTIHDPDAGERAAVVRGSGGGWEIERVADPHAEGYVPPEAPKPGFFKRLLGRG